MAIDFNELRELLAAIATTDISELILKSTDFELTVRKGIHTSLSSAPPLETTSSGAAQTPPAAPPVLPITSGSEAPNRSIEAAPAPPVDKKWVDVKSPMVGTFYRAPSPNDAPFVEVGDRIRTNQTVCIIEAMKLMNEIEAEISGQVMEVLLQNGEPVEYGQSLMRINPD